MYGVAFSPDGSLVAAARQDGSTDIWDVVRRTAAEIPAVGTFPVNDVGAVNAIAFSPAGGAMASASSDDTILLSNATTGTEITTLAGNLQPVEAIGFSPDGRTLASGDADGVVRLWDVRSGRPTGLLSDHTFLPHGRNSYHLRRSARRSGTPSVA